MEKAPGEGKRIQGKSVQFLNVKNMCYTALSLQIQSDTEISAYCLSVHHPNCGGEGRGYRMRMKREVTGAGEAEVLFESKGEFDPNGNFRVDNLPD